MAKKAKVAVCKKCGKEYPRWRSERRAVCEAIVAAKGGLKRCCGSIIQRVDRKKISAYNDGYVSIARIIMDGSGGID